MCGIAGAYRREGRAPIDVDLLERMADVLAHRGPDGSGTWLGQHGRIGFAHRRLAIIDPTPLAAQPMTIADGRYTITFNGEIYNHAEIRRRLEADGIRQWHTDHSDTEVILQSFARWGIDAVHRFRGMFAFGLWDDAERTLWLVRDRVGIKPLYYSESEDGLAFASEIKALLVDPRQRREVNEEALSAYLSFLTTPAPSTLFAGVNKLEAGCWMRIRSDGTITKRRYWDALEAAEPMTRWSHEALQSAVLDRLSDAVRLRKVADVPVGVFLSGGVDSGTNSVLFAQGESRPIKTFSIGYVREYDAYRSELHYARLVAASVGADHHELLLSVDDLLSFLDRMVELQDEPIADPVCVPVYYVSKLARDNGVVVCQVGEGADELFCGYTSWMGMLRLERRLRSPLTQTLMGAASPLLQRAGNRGGFRSEYLRRAMAGRPAFWGGAEAFTTAEVGELLSPRLRSSYDGNGSWDAIAPIRQRFDSSAWEHSDLAWMSYLDLNFRLPELLLMRVDKMSMGVGVECRVPFLDHRLVELAMSIPAEDKLRHGRKGLLREAVRGLLPDEIVDRPKQGFGVPVAEFLVEGLGPFAKAELEAFCREADLLDRRAVQRLVEARSPATWYVLNLAMWWRRFIG